MLCHMLNPLPILAVIDQPPGLSRSLALSINNPLRHCFGRAGVIPAAKVILIGFLGIWLAVVRQTVTRRKSRSRLDGQGPDGHCEYNRGVE